jgi:hypothetical protein
MNLLSVVFEMRSLEVGSRRLVAVTNSSDRFRDSLPLRKNRDTIDSVSSSRGTRVFTGSRTLMNPTKRKCPNCSKFFVLDDDAFNKHVASCLPQKGPLKSFRPDELRKLIDEFRALVKRDEDVKLADALEDELLNSNPPNLKQDTEKRLARWCKTSGIYSDGMEVAWKISRLLFGRIIDRSDYNT